MGRYYDGDIEGKFWFAVQSSTDGEQFGAYEIEPAEIQYGVDEDSLDTCEKRLNEIVKELGITEPLETIDPETVHERVDDNDVTRKTELLASLELGLKIWKCLKEKGECYFTADL